MLMIDMLVGYLKNVGRHKDAAEVEQKWSGGGGTKSDDSPPTTRETEGGRGSGGGSVSADIEATNAPQPAAHGTEAVAAAGGSSQGESASSGGSSGSSAGSSAGAQAAAADAEQGGGQGDAQDGQEPAADIQQTSSAGSSQDSPTPPANLTDDPLAGLHSDFMRELITREAYQSAGGVAVDSATATTAKELREKYLPADTATLKFGPPVIDYSPLAQQSRIAELGGKIPDSIRGTELDPALLRQKERREAAEAIEKAGAEALRAAQASGVTLHQPAPVASGIASLFVDLARTTGLQPTHTTENAPARTTGSAPNRTTAAPPAPPPPAARAAPPAARRQADTGREM
jgi:hypothetical protein